MAHRFHTRLALLFLLNSSGCASLPVSNHTDTSSVQTLQSAQIQDQTHTSRLTLLARNPCIRTVDPWIFADQPGLVITTQRHRIFTTITNPAILHPLPGFLDAAFNRYRTFLNNSSPLPEPSSPLEIYILQTRDQWERLTRVLLGDQADTFLSIDRGGYSVAGKAALFDIGRHDTFLIAAHEGWHQYSQRIFKSPLPIWLEEGLATYMEGHVFFSPEDASPDAPLPPSSLRFEPKNNTERLKELQKASGGSRLKSLQSLLDSSPQAILKNSPSHRSINAADDLARDKQAGAYYAQVWSLTRFLIEGEDSKYLPALEQLLHDAIIGRIETVVADRLGLERANPQLPTFDSAIFAAYFNTDLEQANLEYQRFIARTVQPAHLPDSSPSSPATSKGSSPESRSSMTR